MVSAVRDSNAYDCGIHDDWGRFHGMQIGELWRTEERRALVQLELVGYVELFAEPWYALGLGVLEVVDCKGHDAVLEANEIYGQSSRALSVKTAKQ